jgi:hypothetical protein
MSRSICLLACLLSACASGLRGGTTSSFQAGSDPYVEALIGRAHRLALARHPQWLKLMHARKAPLGDGFISAGYESEADGPAFFLSTRGKVDLGAELDASLRALFSAPDASDPGGADAHPLCRFPARFIFLQRALGFDARRVRVSRCPKFEAFMNELNARSVTLIFSAYYLNNPASAFGHTFLRFDKLRTPGAGKRELLDYGIDFSADADSSNAVVYAFKGLSGAFDGTFKRVPFFYKVREYNDYESRDLWEYQLELAPDQLALLTAHVWELGQTYFDYFYLSENCSYHILSLLEVAKPSLSLLAGLSSPVIPADTVKAVTESEGLVRSVSYRPSLRKQFEARVAGLSDAEQALVERLARSGADPQLARLHDHRRIAVLDAAADLIDVQYARELIHKTESAAAVRKQRLLEARAQILLPSEPLVLATPWRSAPQLGHGSRRLGLGVVLSDRAGSTLDFRLALHDLADATPGYLESSAIEFGRVRLVLWPNRRPDLEDASFVRVTSLNPQSRFDRKMSWEMDVGATTVADSACNRCLAAQLAGGAGLTWSLWDGAVSLATMAAGSLLWSPPMEGLLESHFRLGIGPLGHLRLRLTPRLVALLSARLLWLPAQRPARTYRVDATLRWQYVSDLALGLEARVVPNGLEGRFISFLYF